MPTVNPGEVAIFYATESNILIWKHVRYSGDSPLTFEVPLNQSVLIVSATTPYDDNSCYQLIANVTGKPALNQNSDRCCVIGPDGVTVTAVHKRDPVIMPVQEGETLLVMHHAADIGDQYVAGPAPIFKRRWVHADKSTGIVSHVEWASVGTPVASTFETFAVPHLTADVGHMIPLPKVI